MATRSGGRSGYPTANIDMANYLRPKFGIYAVRGRLADGRVLDGAANLGVRPTFDPPQELLEPYFFDFDGDLYGQTIAVELIDFIRPEAKFDSLDALKAQMDRRCREAKRLLANSSPGTGRGTARVANGGGGRQQYIACDSRPPSPRRQPPP